MKMHHYINVCSDWVLRDCFTFVVYMYDLEPAQFKFPEKRHNAHLEI